MAERLGTGLQNRLQQFESAWDLIKTPCSLNEGFFYSTNSRIYHGISYLSDKTIQWTSYIYSYFYWKASNSLDKLALRRFRDCFYNQIPKWRSPYLLQWVRIWVCGKVLWRRTWAEWIITRSWKLMRSRAKYSHVKSILIFKLTL